MQRLERDQIIAKMEKIQDETETLLKFPIKFGNLISIDSLIHELWYLKEAIDRELKRVPRYVDVIGLTKRTFEYICSQYDIKDLKKIEEYQRIQTFVEDSDAYSIYDVFNIDGIISDSKEFSYYREFPYLMLCFIQKLENECTLTNTEELQPPIDPKLIDTGSKTSSHNSIE